MATETKVTAESSPADILKSLTPEQHKKWRETGELPDFEAKPAVPPTAKTEQKTEADSSPAAKDEVVEEKAESAPATAEPSKMSRGKNAETRIKELLAENKKLALEVEQLRKPPAAAPAKKEEAVAKPHRNDVDQKTGQPLYATDDEFLDARDKWVFDQASKQTRADIAKEQADLRIAEQNRLNLQRWQNNLKIAKQTYADFDKVCGIDEKGVFQNADLKSIKEHGIVDAWALDSDYGGLLLYYFASHPGEVARIEALGSFSAARELTRIEERLSEANAAKSNGRSEEGSKPQVSKAPAPATSVGGKATAPVDEEEAATEAGDFRRYMRVANEREHAKRKGS